MSAPQIKPEYDHGDYPVERYAYEAKRALEDYMAVSNLPESHRKTHQASVDLLNLHMLDDMAGFDGEAPF